MGLQTFAALLVGVLCLGLAHGQEISTFTQYIDHENKALGTYQQRYQTFNGTWKGPGTGPVFIFLAGEAAMGFFAFQEVLARDLAVKHNALYIKLEHRYYGYSQPFSNYSTPNLQYLSSQQALADAANFILTMNQDLKGHPWIIWGCSYSGALSAWFRSKYPHIVQAAVAPSGPVLAKADFSAYLDWFAYQAPADCLQRTHTATAEINKLMKSESGKEEIARRMKVCGGKIPKEDEQLFLYSINGALGSADQFDSPHSNFTLNATCDVLLKGSDPLEAWGNVVRGDSSCFSASLEGYIASMHDLNPNTTQRSWWWQKCNEFGFFKPSESPYSPFPPQSFTFIQGLCAKFFDVPGLVPRIDYTNQYYGGYQLNGSNILFTNGERDPWHLLSIDWSRGQIGAVTYEAGHCAPMTRPQSNDEPSLRHAREVVAQFVASIIANQGQLPPQWMEKHL